MYKSFYRVYRPKKINEVVGQDHIVKTLVNAINRNKINHSYLFSGPRGTGKTSLARIFAQTINCEPCYKDTFNVKACNICLLSKKYAIDIVEIDAASNNGVAEIRNIIDNATYVPATAKYKVYIIDEAHMLTKAAFNAFLKMLEEPPANIVFILATTEIYKIPLTILSRLQRFNFHRINNDQIILVLKSILKSEKIDFEEKALTLIAKISQGSLRDALSLAEQVANYSDDNTVKAQQVIESLSLISISDLIILLNLTFKSSVKEFILKINSFIEKGIDIARAFEMILELLKDFIIFKKSNDPTLLTFVEVSDLEEAEFDTDFAYSAANLFFENINQVQLHIYGQQILEFTLLKLANQMSKPIQKVTEKIVQETKDSIDLSNEVENESLIDVVAEFNIKSGGNNNLSAKTDSSQTETNDIEILKDDFKLDEDFPLSGDAYKLTEEVAININDRNATKLEFDDTRTDDFLIDDLSSDFNTNSLHELKSVSDLIFEEDETGEYDVDTSTITMEITSEIDETGKKKDTAEKIEKNYHDKSFHDRLLDLSDVVKSEENQVIVNKLKKKSNVSPVDNTTTKQSSIFNFDDLKKISKTTPKISKVDQIVNLLTQADKEAYSTLKQRWNNKEELTNTSNFSKYEKYFNQAKPITGSSEFFLIAFDNENILNEFKQEADDAKFKSFTISFLNSNVRIFAISKTDFIEAKDLWIKLNSTNKLPKSIKISDIIV